jgi:hypothetical protein
MPFNQSWRLQIVFGPYSLSFKTFQQKEPSDAVSLQRLDQ